MGLIPKPLEHQKYRCPDPTPRDARLWPEEGTSHVCLSRTVLVFAPEVPTILPGFVKTPRNLECAVRVKEASLERETGDPFRPAASVLGALAGGDS